MIGKYYACKAFKCIILRKGFNLDQAKCFLSFIRRYLSYKFRFIKIKAKNKKLLLYFVV